MQNNIKVPILNGYPDELSFDESDNYDIIYTGDNEIEAIQISEQKSGQMYTQVDAENEDGGIYLRGHHIVNRTGIYIVARKR